MTTTPNTSTPPPAVERMEVEEELSEEILKMSTGDLRSRTQLLDNQIRILRSEVQRINHATQTLKDRIKENSERIKVNKQLPYLVSNVVELLDLEDTQEEEGANVDLDAHKTKCAVIKTSTRATYFLPVVGLVDPVELKPGDLVGVNKDSYLILEKLPAEYDSRVKAMEVDERPTEQYSDIGGCDKQIQELIEAVVLPMTHKDRFINLGIHPPKGVLMYGPPGTGKTMMARAVAAQTKSTFLKLAGPQLVQMFIGDGAKLVRDAFALAKEKAPAIIFIDELDAIGTKRFDSEKAGDREVQRTMLELLNQLDGFQPNDEIKVIAATNRIDVLDPALLRSGRLDRKIELPHPNEDARARIMQIHSRKMNVHKDVNFEELARCTDDFNGAQCKAVCVEAGMIALRRDATEVLHEDFMDAILEVQAKKKVDMQRIMHFLKLKQHNENLGTLLELQKDLFKELTHQNEKQGQLFRELGSLVNELKHKNDELIGIQNKISPRVAIEMLEDDSNCKTGFRDKNFVKLYKKDYHEFAAQLNKKLPHLVDMPVEQRNKIIGKLATDAYRLGSKYHHEFDRRKGVHIWTGDYNDDIIALFKAICWALPCSLSIDGKEYNDPDGHYRYK